MWSTTSCALRSIHHHRRHHPLARALSATSWQRDWAQHHRPVGVLDKLVLSTGSAVLALLDTHRGDLIATMTETLPLTTLSLTTLHQSMFASDEGRTLLSEKPRITDATLSLLSSMGPNTLGYMYYRYMSDNSFSPTGRSMTQYIEDSELAYVLQRYRECHDVWHVVTGNDSDILGELSQKVFELYQTRLAMTLLTSMIGTVKLSNSDRTLFFTVYLPWAVQCGRESESLMGVYWERYWHEDIDELRRRYRVTVAPPRPTNRH